MSKVNKLILSYRKEAGISNDNVYIFSRPTSSSLTKGYYRACPLLKTFSKECGAKIPDTLSGTTLRKHIATYTSLLNVEEASVERLANFMGHHKDIHKNIYRMPIPVAEITCVSKLLMAAVGGENDMDEDEEDDEIDSVAENMEELVTCELGNDSLNSSSGKKRRSRSPFGKTKRLRWTDAEREAVSSIFGNILEMKQLPSLIECHHAVKNFKDLKGRTPEQLKSWIDNQRCHNNKETHHKAADAQA